MNAQFPYNYSRTSHPCHNHIILIRAILDTMPLMLIKQSYLQASQNIKKKKKNHHYKLTLCHNRTFSISNKTSIPYIFNHTLHNLLLSKWNPLEIQKQYSFLIYCIKIQTKPNQQFFFFFKIKVRLCINKKKNVYKLNGLARVYP